MLYTNHYDTNFHNLFNQFYEFLLQLWCMWGRNDYNGYLAHRSSNHQFWIVTNLTNFIVFMLCLIPNVNLAPHQIQPPISNLHQLYLWQLWWCRHEGGMITNLSHHSQNSKNNQNFPKFSKIFFSLSRQTNDKFL